MSNSNVKVANAVIECPHKEDVSKKKSNIVIQCDHRLCPEISHLKAFELVPNVDFPVSDAITIDWSGNDPVPPSSITVIEDDKTYLIAGPPYKIPLDNAKSKSIFPDLYSKKSGEILEFGKELLADISTINCNRTLEIDNLPFNRMTIVIHNPDKWKLNFKFPLPKRYEKKCGVKWEGIYNRGKVISKDSDETTGEATLKESTEISKGKYENYIFEENKKTLTVDGKSESQTTYAAKYDDGTKTSVPKTQQKNSPEDIVKISRNGSLLTTNPLGVLHFIAQLMKWMQNISELLNDIPKAGAYMEWKWSLLEGEFSVEWGWKESTDHSAFYSVKGDFDATIVDIDLELGVGASAFSVKFQAFVKLQGKILLNASLERTEKDVQSEDKYSVRGPLHAKINSGIEGSVGARFEAGYFVKIEASVSSGLEMTGEISLAEGQNIFNVESQLNFTGIKGTVTTSIGLSDVLGEQKQWDPEKNLDKVTDNKIGVRTGGDTGSSKSSRQQVFMDSYQFAYWKWPDAFHKYAPDEKINEKDVKESIKDMFNGQYTNSGFLNGKKIRIKNWMDLKELAEENSISRFVKYGVLGQDPVKDKDLDKVVEFMLDKMNKQPFFDYSKKSLELFLLEVRQDLDPLLQDRKGHYFELQYIEWSDFKKYINSSKFYSILKNHLDFSAEFMNENKIA